MALFDLLVAKEDFKFSAAHFVAHGGEREKLHGHNYRVAVGVRGPMGEDGCVMDFAEVKRAVRALCKELDEKFLCPMASPSIRVSLTDTQVELRVVHDGTFFSLPKGDVLCLPLANSTVEELAVYLARRLVAAVGLERLRERGVESVTLGVTETPGQEARFTLPLAGLDAAALAAATAACAVDGGK